MSEIECAEQASSSPITDFDFFNHIQYESVHLARMTSMLVSCNPGQLYNPLVIYGAYGLGTTHLMHAIWDRVASTNPHGVTCYIHSWRFSQNTADDVADSSKYLLEQYRQADMLLIDDIELLTKNEQAKAALYALVKEFIETGRQVVLTCDTNPVNITGYDDHLKALICSGRSVQVGAPDAKGGIDIITFKASQQGFLLTPDTAMVIAMFSNATNVRELEGALRRVIANASFLGAPVTKELSIEILSSR